jgi:Redoxin
MKRHTAIFCAGLSVATFLAWTVPWQAAATGRYASTEPTSHPKTKGVPPGPGSHVPTLNMTDTAGQTFSLTSLRGRPIVLEWTNYECPYVSRHYGSGNMQAVQRQAMAGGATWITIFSSAPGKQGFLDARGADYFSAQKNATPSRKVLDPSGAVGRAFGARTTPHMFVIDERGTIIYAGAIDDQPRAVVAEGTPTRNYVLEALSANARGQTPAVRATAAYGCSIKY